MKKFRTAALTAGMAFLVAQSVSATLLIDTFTTGQNVDIAGANAQPPGPKSVSNTRNAVDSLGGERDFFLQRTSGNAGDIGVDTNNTRPSFLAYNSAAFTQGSALISWDGDDDSGTTLNHTGLNHVDLTESGMNDGFVFDIASDLGGLFTITVYTDATHYSMATLMVPATPQFNFTLRTILFSSFTPGGSMGGADFSDVGAITMLIDGTTVPATDMVIDNLAVTRTPEPSTFALMLLGTGGLVGLGRRWRKRA